MKEENLEQSIDDAMDGLQESTELGELAREFTKSHISSSNLSKDEHILTWRAKNILRRLSPKSVRIIDEFIDGKRSVGGWNTDKKVEAITGTMNQRSGNGLMERFFRNNKQG